MVKDNSRLLLLEERDADTRRQRDGQRRHEDRHERPDRISAEVVTTSPELTRRCILVS
jgi:hypothetical protein